MKATWFAIRPLAARPGGFRGMNYDEAIALAAKGAEIVADDKCCPPIFDGELFFQDGTPVPRGGVFTVRPDSREEADAGIPGAGPVPKLRGCMHCSRPISQFEDGPYCPDCEL